MESRQPIAAPAADGKYSPIDLALRSSGAGFRPIAPLVAVDLPRHLDQGIAA
jgi:hypothetical protein